MAYVDLNPIRAAMADCPEHSDFTSIQQRIREYQQQPAEAVSPALKPFSPKQSDIERAVPFDLADYIALVDWTGRCCRSDKRGGISDSLPPILERLGIDADQWLRAMQPKGLQLSRALGRIEKLKQYAGQVGNKWVKGSVSIETIVCRCIGRAGDTGCSHKFLRGILMGVPKTLSIHYKLRPSRLYSDTSEI